MFLLFDCLVSIKIVYFISLTLLGYNFPGTRLRHLKVKELPELFTPAVMNTLNVFKCYFI